MSFLRKVFTLLRGRDRGAVAIQFILTLPILLTIVGVLVQYALLVNAKFAMDRALAAAARSAVTSLPTNQTIGEPGGYDYPRRAALMVLATLSPPSPFGPSGEGQVVADSLASLGAAPPTPTFASGYAYAEAATELLIPGGNYAQSPGSRIEITLTYDFRLTVPGVNALIGRSDTVAGVEGRFRRLTSTMTVQLSPGREAGRGGAP